MKIDLVVFDMAGTTVYDGDAVGHALREALGSAGVEVTRDEVNRVMGTPKPLAIRQLLEWHQEESTDVADEDARRVYEVFLARMLAYYETDPHVREVPGAAETFRKLRKAGVRVALDTGFSRPIADAILRRLGWDGAVVDATVTSDEVPRGRPYPDMIFRAMEWTGVTDPARVAKVGDTPADLQQGAAAGCGRVIGVTEGTHTREELASHPHTDLIPTVAALPRLVLDRLLFTPGPLTTSPTVKQAMLRDLGTRDYEFIDLVRRIRGRLLDLAGVSQGGVSQGAGYEAILMQGSGTFGVESVLSSVIPPDGALLVAANGAYGERMARIADVLKIPIVPLWYPEDTPVDAGDVRRALAQNPSVTHVGVVHCETTTGILNPIETIGPEVREAGRSFIVDAMSSFGAMPIDLTGAGIDYLIASPNKCIEGVAGFSFILARRDALLATEGWARSLSLDLLAQWRGLEEEGQFRFTPPTHALMAFDRALDELEAEGGVGGREARYRSNQVALVTGMRALGFQPYLTADRQGPFITAFHVPTDPRFDYEAFYRRLHDRGYVIYAGKVSREATFRIGSIGRIDASDVQELLGAVRETLEEAGIPLPLR